MPEESLSTALPRDPVLAPRAGRPTALVDVDSPFLGVGNSRNARSDQQQQCADSDQRLDLLPGALLGRTQLFFITVYFPFAASLPSGLVAGRALLIWSPVTSGAVIGSPVSRRNLCPGDGNEQNKCRRTARVPRGTRAPKGERSAITGGFQHRKLISY